MSNVQLLGIEPSDLRFAFELRKQISCTLHLANKTDDYVAFKVKTTNPKKYCVRPNTGVVLPRSTCDVIVTMQAQKDAPFDLQCRDKFLVQGVVATAGATAKDITSEMFSRESGNTVEESKLRVVYVAPPQPPSPVAEGSEEGGSPRLSVSNNNVSDMVNQAPRGIIESRQGHSEAGSIISKLTNEKNSAIQQNNNLRQELEALRREISKQNSGFPFMFVVIVAVLGVLLGYLLKT